MLYKWLTLFPTSSENYLALQTFWVPNARGATKCAGAAWNPASSCGKNESWCVAFYLAPSLTDGLGVCLVVNHICVIGPSADSH